ncbi:tetrapyrrole methylase family protein/MazG family protein/ATP diphosphatase [Povalibacter uvarum]|uniref:Nucleoside triphosphate pyrophosphohydrolase n=1 Tax=Povalibacter uvarum TaxID=732238 RepID=A0A841HIY6_9GAMM|nr:nucleoside triphosphate pyrophosphohydrolase [Povalibacter uvarum]MBB6092188.1 tetrapyrrole methylase family protein/MazG family protein/ATP diphosphatase [Povalibacter uvarum]
MPITRLLEIMARLRDPRRGCPWDLQQNFSTIAPYTIEEAYEVADAIERNNLPQLRDELGDLLFQIAFHSQLAKEQGAFAFDDVVAAICDKMERRHPHVFGTATIADAEQQTIAWEEQKRRERAALHDSVLDDVPVGLPALTRANKLGKRAAQVGFEWADVSGAIDKVQEEIGELRQEIATGADPKEVEQELGDLLFCLVNVCRYLKIDPENALRLTNAKFERRFRHIERRLNEQGKTPKESTLEEMDSLWDEAKREGK